jgi:ATP-dependent RNA helicase SUPV3L1/SUV3
VPLDRKYEQKLWDAFRKPIDDAFNRKSAEREKAAGRHERARQAPCSTPPRRWRRPTPAATPSASAPPWRSSTPPRAARPPPRPVLKKNRLQPGTDTVPDAPESGATEAASAAEGDAGEGAGAAPAPAPAAPLKPAKPLIAMRGDDRPGARKSEPAPARGGKFGDRAGGRPGGPGGRDGRPGGFGGRDARGGGDRFGDRNDRFPREDRGPRLGDAAFRAQRDAVEHAEAALRKLAAQAHGEALTQLLTAWQQRQPDQVPSVQELGRAVTPAVRGAWTQALGASAGGNAGKSAEALLRLEMAAEVPTPADHLDARRALQLQLLTRRNDPAPTQTWGQDAAAVLAAGYDEAGARRLQNALKGLLRK